MANQLKVDIDQLERIRLKLSQVTTLLSGEDTFSAEAADFVGRDTATKRALAQQVHDFGTSWNNRREKLVARLDRVEDAVGKIGSSFDAVETELQKGILGESSAGGKG